MVLRNAVLGMLPKNNLRRVRCCWGGAGGGAAGGVPRGKPAVVYSCAAK